MTKEKQQALYDKYPLIFQQKDLSMSQTCMCWGICTGDGWYDIIDEICAGLEKLRYEYGVIVMAAQVKEKFGTLRFYTEYSPMLLKLTKDEYDKIYELAQDIVSAGEDKSCITCEQCGQPGTQNKGGWVRTSCASCEEEYKKQRRPR